MAKEINWLVVIIFVAAAVLIFKPDLIGLGGEKAAEVAASTTAQAAGCNLLSAPTITPKYLDAYTKAAISAVDHSNAWVDGVMIDDVSGAFGSVAGIDYKLLTNSTASNQHYNALVSGTTKCQPDEPVQVLMYKNTTPTLTFYNTDDQPATDQAVGTAEEKNFKWKIASTTDKCYGNPQVGKIDSTAGIVMALNYNTSLFSKVEILSVTTVAGDVSGTAGKAVKVSVPSTNVSEMEEAYKIPVWAVCDDGEVKGTGRFVAKAGMNPDTTDDPYVYLYEPLLFVQVDTTDIAVGIEDKDGNDKGIYHPGLDLQTS